MYKRQQQPGGFGQPATTGFGQTQQPGGFGQPATTGFGQTQQQQPGGFGQTQQPGGFGQPATTGFGQTQQQQPGGFGKPAFGPSNTFQPMSSFGQSNNAFATPTAQFQPSSSFQQSTYRPQSFGQSAPHHNTVLQNLMDAYAKFSNPSKSVFIHAFYNLCLLYTSPSPRD